MSELQSQASTSTTPSSSRSTSPDTRDQGAVSIPQDFFKAVNRDGFPTVDESKAKKQPWRAHWSGPEKPKDGQLLVACPKKCDFGSNNIGGL